MTEKDFYKIIMILDFHNHIFPENVAPKVIESLQKEMGFTPYGRGTVSGLREEMKTSGIRVCVALALAASPSLVTPTNDWLLSEREDELIPIGSIHPSLEDFKFEVKEASMAKFFATEMAQRVIDQAVQIFGGFGVTKGNPAERLYREVRAIRIYEGTT